MRGTNKQIFYQSDVPELGLLCRYFNEMGCSSIWLISGLFDGEKIAVAQVILSASNANILYFILNHDHHPMIPEAERPQNMQLYPRIQCSALEDTTRKAHVGKISVSPNARHVNIPQTLVADSATRAILIVGQRTRAYLRKGRGRNTAQTNLRRHVNNEMNAETVEQSASTKMRYIRFDDFIRDICAYVSRMRSFEECVCYLRDRSYQSNEEQDGYLFRFYSYAALW